MDDSTDVEIQYEFVSEGGNRYRQGFSKASMLDLKAKNTHRVVRRELILTGGKDLYHYTSLGGFKGVIESSGFWASDNRFLNDAEEMAHGVELAESAILHKIRRTKDENFARILEEVRKKICEPRLNGNLVACFSTARDSLEQWRGYGASGVCIKLGAAKTGQRPVFFGPSQLPHKVFYNRSEKLTNLLSALGRFEDEYRLDRDFMNGYWPDDHDELYISHLAPLISSRIVGFKNPAFKLEAEVRIVIHYAYVSDYKDGLKFRPSPFGLIPYVCTGDRIGQSGLLPIDEVMIGPSPRQELVADSVRSFLYHKGYRDTQVSLSTVPFRS